MYYRRCVGLPYIRINLAYKCQGHTKLIYRAGVTDTAQQVKVALGPLTTFG